MRDQETPGGRKRWTSFYVSDDKGKMIDITRPIAALLGYEYDRERKALAHADRNSSGAFWVILQLERLLWPSVRRRRGFDVLKAEFIY